MEEWCKSCYFYNMNLRLHPRREKEKTLIRTKIKLKFEEVTGNQKFILNSNKDGLASLYQRRGFWCNVVNLHFIFMFNQCAIWKFSKDITYLVKSQCNLLRLILVVFLKFRIKLTWNGANSIWKSARQVVSNR